jgi:L-fuconolactonase
MLDRHGITQTVLVQAAPTVSETEYLLAIADRTPSVAAVTGWIDMRGDPAFLARLSRHPKLRAIRPMLQDIPDADWILAPACRPMLAAIAQHGLVFEFLGKPRHLATALRLLDENAALTVVIDHGMKPDIAAGAFDDWAARMADIAARPNALCKLSGLVTEAGSDWSISRIERYVRHLVDSFGPDRVMWGSDWPVVDLAGGYDAWRAATLALLDSRNEAPAILGATAARVYRIGAVRHAAAP